METGRAFWDASLCACSFFFFPWSLGSLVWSFSKTRCRTNMIHPMDMNITAQKHSYLWPGLFQIHSQAFTECYLICFRTTNKVNLVLHLFCSFIFPQNLLQRGIDTVNQAKAARMHVVSNLKNKAL